MSDRNLARWVVPAVCAAALALATGCTDSDSVLGPPGGGGGLVVSNANPSDGDGNLDAPTLFHDTNQGVDMLDALYVSQTVGPTGHEISIYWDPSTSEIRSIQHAWGPAAGGPSSGTTGCCAPPGSCPSSCDPAEVSVDTGTQTVTFTGLVIDDMFGGTDTSQIDGSVTW